MNRKSITLTIDSQSNDYIKNLNLSKDFFDLEYFEVSKFKNVGYNKNSNFIVNYNESIINLIFLQEVNDEEVDVWEKKLVDFTKKISLNNNALLQRNFDSSTQYELLTN